jgi:hypothetical protein
MEGRDALPVEPGDPMGDGIPAPAAGRPGGRWVVGPVGHGEEDGRASDADRGCGRRSADMGEVSALVVRAGAERILPAT